MIEGLDSGDVLSSSVQGDRTLPLTGVPEFDRLARGTTEYNEWKAALEANGIRVTEKSLAEGTRAFYESGTEIAIDPRQFRALDIAHEQVHFEQIQRAKAAKLEIDFSAPNKRQLGIAEYGAYRREIELGRLHGFSREYMDYLHQRLNDYWGKPQKEVLRSSTGQREFEILTGRSIDPNRDILGRPGDQLPP